MTDRHQLGHHRTTPDEGETENMGGCLTRVVWLVVAPLALLMLGAVVARDGNGVWSPESMAYLAIIVVSLAVRYIDIFRYGGQTLSGQPASREDWRRYRVRFPALALAGLSAALILGAA